MYTVTSVLSMGIRTSCSDAHRTRGRCKRSRRRGEDSRTRGDTESAFADYLSSVVSSEYRSEQER